MHRSADGVGPPEPFIVNSGLYPQRGKAVSAESRRDGLRTVNRLTVVRQPHLPPWAREGGRQHWVQPVPLLRGGSYSHDTARRMGVAEEDESGAHEIEPVPLFELDEAGAAAGVRGRGEAQPATDDIGGGLIFPKFEKKSDLSRPDKRFSRRGRALDEIDSSFISFVAVVFSFKQRQGHCMWSPESFPPGRVFLFLGEGVIT